MQVEELGLVDLGVHDQFPAIIADGTLKFGVGREDRVAAARGGSARLATRLRPSLPSGAATPASSPSVGKTSSR